MNLGILIRYGKKWARKVLGSISSTISKLSVSQKVFNPKMKDQQVMSLIQGEYEEAE